MSVWSSLFQARLALDGQRQERHGDALRVLAARLEQLPAPPPPSAHPYNLAKQHQEWLVDRDPAFRGPSQGHVVQAPAGDYLFRFQNFKALLYLHERRRVETYDDDEWHRKLVQEHRRTGNWIGLARVIRGPYRGRRALSWWTSQPLSASEIVAAVYRIGMARNWLTPRGLILRCRRKALVDARLSVPTVLDAFDQPIFLATSDGAQPSAGHAIDLTRPDALTIGDDEYVAGEIAVSQIDFIPLEIPAAAATDPHFVEDGAPLLDHLLAFYNTQITG